jgi:hypothetical protein
VNASFNFIFGKPAGDGVGRWVEGTVNAAKSGYTFLADLLIRHSDAVLQCHPVRLKVDRPSHADDFAAYLRSVSTGKFETVSRILGLYETKELDPVGAAAIFDATSIWVDPWDHEGVSLLEDLASLGDQLDQLHKRERLSLAIAKFSGGTWTQVSRVRPSAHNGDAE